MLSQQSRNLGWVAINILPSICQRMWACKCGVEPVARKYPNVFVVYVDIRLSINKSYPRFPWLKEVQSVGGDCGQFFQAHHFVRTGNIY